MSQLRRLTWSLGVVMFLASACTVRAAEPAQPREGQLSRPGLPVFSLLERMNHLLVPGAQEKLNLNAQQLDRITKLQYEFRAQRRDMLTKIADNLANKCCEKDAQGEEHFDLKQGAFTLFTGLLQIRGARDNFEAKARDLLTDDQKKQYLHLENEWSRRLSERRAERRHSGELRIFSAPSQENLNLTAEQRQKLGKLFQDTDSKLKSILTDEQYQQLQPPHQRRLEQGQPGAEQLHVSPASSESSK